MTHFPPNQCFPSLGLFSRVGLSVLPCSHSFLLANSPHSPPLISLLIPHPVIWSPLAHPPSSSWPFLPQSGLLDLLTLSPSSVICITFSVSFLAYLLAFVDWLPPLSFKVISSCLFCQIYSPVELHFPCHLSSIFQLSFLSETTPELHTSILHLISPLWYPAFRLQLHYALTLWSCRIALPLCTSVSPSGKGGCCYYFPVGIL